MFLLIRLIANDLWVRNSRRRWDIFRCFVSSNMTVWHDGNVYTVVRSTRGHPPQTSYTHKNRLRDGTDIEEIEVIKEMAKELGEKATVLTMRWKTIRRVQIFRVELCIIVAIIPSPPPTSLLTDSMTDSLLSLSLSFRFILPLVLLLLLQ